MDTQDTVIAQLREAIETVADRKMRTPKDFDFLSDAIFEKLHQKVSTTTLKRLWGYLSEPVTPRTSTLDLLSQFVGNSIPRPTCLGKGSLLPKEKRGILMLKYDGKG